VGQKGQQDLDAVGRHEAQVMIAKALSHEPRILFLDEPTAGVDVELRRDYVGDGAIAARDRCNHYSHHSLHPGGRRDG